MSRNTVNNSNIHRIITILKKQVKTLNVPYLEKKASTDKDPFKVLTSCILSLRTQDRTTAKASERLFMLAATPEKMSSIPVKKIEKAIYPVGFYRIKAQKIRDMSKKIVNEYNGTVPDSIDELLKFNGVGRKTANLVVTLSYNKYGICTTV